MRIRPLICARVAYDYVRTYRTLRYVVREAIVAANRAFDKIAHVIYVLCR